MLITGQSYIEKVYFPKFSLFLLAVFYSVCVYVIFFSSCLGVLFLFLFFFSQDDSSGSDTPVRHVRRRETHDHYCRPHSLVVPFC